MRRKRLVILVACAMILSVFPIMSVEGATDPDIQTAISNGVAYLAANQNPDGSWGSYDPMAHTGLVLIKLQDRAYELGYDSPFDPTYPYKNNVVNGLVYLINIAGIQTLAIQDHTAGASGTLDDPDTNGNGFGIRFPAGSHEIYSTGICLMTLVATGRPNRVNDAGRDFDMRR